MTRKCATAIRAADTVLMGKGCGGGGHRHPVDHGAGLAAGQNLGQNERVGPGGAERDRDRASVVEPMGDTPYGEGGTRQDFGDAGQKLLARVPGRSKRKRFPKDDFAINLVAGACTCPAGQATRQVVSRAAQTHLTCRAGRLPLQH